MNPNKLTPGYNVMWESSRMMLPEHREQLLAKKRKEREFRPPELSEEQLNDMNRIIAASIEEDRPFRSPTLPHTAPPLLGLGKTSDA